MFSFLSFFFVFWVLRVFYVQCQSSANSDSFTSFLSIWIPFISFSCMIPLSKTSNTMINRNYESGHPCLIPHLRKNFHVFNIVYDASCGLVINCFYYVEISFCYINFESLFKNHKWMLNFLKCFFCLCWDDHVIFVLHFVNVVYHIDWFAHIEPSLCPWNKFHLIMVHNPFCVLLNLVC